MGSQREMMRATALLCVASVFICTVIHSVECDTQWDPSDVKSMDAQKERDAANPSDASGEDAAQAKHMEGKEKAKEKAKLTSTLAKHGEAHAKATKKVKELQKKLGITGNLPQTNKMSIQRKYDYYAQKEREQKRSRFPAVTNKEMAVKRVYEIMHKSKHLNYKQGGTGL